MPSAYDNRSFLAKEKKKDVPRCPFPSLRVIFYRARLHVEGFSSSLCKALQLISAEVVYFSQFKLHLHRCFDTTTVLNCCSFLSVD